MQSAAGMVCLVDDHQVPGSGGDVLSVPIHPGELERADHVRLNRPRVVTRAFSPDPRDLGAVEEREVLIELRVKLEAPLAAPSVSRKLRRGERQ